VSVAARILWDGGGAAAIEALEDDHIELVSSRAFAPGSRPQATLEEGGDRIWLKVHGSRRQDDGAFRMQGRLLNTRREVLDRLKAAVLGRNGGKSPGS
jgi:hypothetical protein